MNKRLKSLRETKDKKLKNENTSTNNAFILKTEREKTDKLTDENDTLKAELRRARQNWLVVEILVVHLHLHHSHLV